MRKKPENAIPLGESIVRYLLSWDINFFQFRCTNTGRRNSLLNIISSSISTSIFFKSKNRRVEKKEGTVEARPIRYSILRLFSFTWERGGAKCENKCRFYYSLRPVPFYERYTEWRLREREEKNDSKGFGHDFSERFYDSLLVCQLSGDIDCYHGRVESRT